MMDDREFTTLAQALLAFGVPLENHAYVTRICEQTGTVRYEILPSYVKALRSEGLAPLWIGSGWTIGFSSEAEARAAAGESADVWESTSSRPGSWGVTHPLNRRGVQAGAHRPTDVDLPTCESCFVQLPATGVCDTCG